MKTNTNRILKGFHILSWILFIGMCVEAGSFIFNMTYSLTYQPLAADYLGLSDLLAHGKGYFAMIMTIMTIAAVLKTLALYAIVKVFTDKKLDMAMPFSPEFGRFIFKLAYLALATGIFSFLGAKSLELLAEKGIALPDLQRLRLDGADVWMFMSATLYVIALLFKRGVEIQSENELTI